MLELIGQHIEFVIGTCVVGFIAFFVMVGKKLHLLKQTSEKAEKNDNNVVKLNEKMNDLNSQVSEKINVLNGRVSKVEGMFQIIQTDLSDIKEILTKRD